MGKRSSAKKLVGKALGGISGVSKVAGKLLPGPLGLVAKGIGAVTGLGGGSKGTKGGRKNRFSITKYARRILKAKLDAKLMRIKMSPLRGL